MPSLRFIGVRFTDSQLILDSKSVILFLPAQQGQRPANVHHHHRHFMKIGFLKCLSKESPKMSGNHGHYD